MKGQFTIEYIVSFLIFVSIVSYINLSTSKFLPGYVSKAKDESTFSYAYFISEVLINDPGEPPDWVNLSSDQIKRIGLSDERYNRTNLLSLSKIQEFCRSYSFVKEKLGAERDFIVMIIDREKNFNDVVCKGEITKTRINVTVRRIVAYTYGNDFGLAELIVQAW